MKNEKRDDACHGFNGRKTDHVNKKPDSVCAVAGSVCVRVC